MTGTSTTTSLHKRLFEFYSLNRNSLFCLTNSLHFTTTTSSITPNSIHLRGRLLLVRSQCGRVIVSVRKISSNATTSNAIHIWDNTERLKSLGRGVMVGQVWTNTMYLCMKSLRRGVVVGGVWTNTLCLCRVNSGRGVVVGGVWTKTLCRLRYLRKGVVTMKVGMV